MDSLSKDSSAIALRANKGFCVNEKFVATPAPMATKADTVPVARADIDPDKVSSNNKEQEGYGNRTANPARQNFYCREDNVCASADKNKNPKDDDQNISFPGKRCPA